MKVKASRELLKSILTLSPKTCKSRQYLHEILLFSQQVPQPHISKTNLLILLPSLFQIISQSPGQDQQNGKRTKCQLLP